MLHIYPRRVAVLTWGHVYFKHMMRILVSTVAAYAAMAALGPILRKEKVAHTKRNTVGLVAGRGPGVLDHLHT